MMYTNYQHPEAENLFEGGKKVDKFHIYNDIAERTQGDIYIGVVGPVRTGKSTFIKRFMDLLVIPNIENSYRKERAKDELPQSGAGKTIMTTEPKFVPNEAVELTLKDSAKFKVRLSGLCRNIWWKEPLDMKRTVSLGWLQRLGMKKPFLLKKRQKSGREKS